MTGNGGRLRALAEVALVLVGTLVVVGVVARSGIAGWERSHLHRPFAEYAALGLVPLLVMLASRGPRAEWGLAIRPLAFRLDAALRCMVPFAVAQALVMGIRQRPVLQGIVETVAAAVALPICARLLGRGSAPGGALAAAVLVAVPAAVPGRALSALVFYPLLLGPAEEILFRGYIQSRLDRAFGRPHLLLGARCGAGLFIMAGLFAAFHVLNLPRLYAGAFEPLWHRALPTFVWGVFFGYLRERTGSLVTPAAVHGVPQAIAWALLGR